MKLSIGKFYKKSVDTFQFWLTFCSNNGHFTLHEGVDVFLCTEVTGCRVSSHAGAPTQPCGESLWCHSAICPQLCGESLPPTALPPFSKVGPGRHSRIVTLCIHFLTSFFILSRICKSVRVVHMKEATSSWYKRVLPTTWLHCCFPGWSSFLYWEPVFLMFFSWFSCPELSLELCGAWGEAACAAPLLQIYTRKKSWGLWRYSDVSIL
jgi:hypothetical protein